MQLNRNFVTPFITLVFLAVALTGVLMFFQEISKSISRYLLLNTGFKNQTIAI